MKNNPKNKSGHNDSSCNEGELFVYDEDLLIVHNNERGFGVKKKVCRNIPHSPLFCVKKLHGFVMQSSV